MRKHSQEEREEKMDISVMSREEAIRRFGTHRDETAPVPHGTAIISITTPEPFCGRLGSVEFEEDAILGVLHSRFGDVLPGEETEMTDEQARQIVDFVQVMRVAGMEHLVVHCDGGVSRSAGVAAALGIIVGTGDSFVFDDPWKCPNMGCYKKVLRAGGVRIDDAEIDAKERHNEEIWMLAHAEDLG